MQINETRLDGKVEVSSVSYGELFRYKQKVWMKAYPHGFITKSSVLRAVMARGDFLAIEMGTGQVTAWRKDALVEPLTSELQYCSTIQ